MKRKNEPTNRGMHRRDFIKHMAVGAATIGATTLAPGLVRTAGAAKRDYVLIGQPSPLTGPLAPFGEPTPWLTKKVAAEINKDGGIFIKQYGKKMPVKIKTVDTESNPTKAAEVSARLIMHDKIDLMVVLHAPTTVDPVIGVCERLQMPCIALDSPLDSFFQSGPHKWAYLAFWTVVEDIMPLFTGMWEQIETNKNVGLLFVSDPGGIPWSIVFNEVLPKKSYHVVDKGLFPPGNKDFSAYIDAWRKAKVDIVTGNLAPPDWITCWRQCQQMGYKPKIATIGRAILFPSVMEAMGGDLGNGLSSEIWWSPHHPFKSSLTGASAKDLCAAWENERNKPWTQPLGYEYAAYEIVADVLIRAEKLDKETLRQTIATTELDTIVGKIKYNDKNYCRTPVVGGQWIKGKKFPWDLQITYNAQHPEIPLTGKMFAL